MRIPNRVAVLGAGLSGAAAARDLMRAGFDVVVLDKSRGVGGRMATRRVPGRDLAFDHGAQFMRARGTAFAAQIEDWRARGVVAPWGGHDRFVGTPTMTAPARDILAGLDVRAGMTVTGIARDADGWHVSAAEGAITEAFGAVAIGFPAPQTFRLLEASGLALPGIETVTYAPCWSLMLALDGPAAFPESDRRDRDGPIAAVIRDESRPGRPPGTRLLVHAGPDWSRRHLEDAREAVAEALLAELAILLGQSIVPAYASAHRWRYALVETALGQDCLYDPTLGLGACGDWCLGPRIEAAFDSGTALAARIAADLAAGSEGI
ncbi:NAD(P)/FAD-dependent oxidoreductase [uncultured Methylobacterium sp.]|uniref:NAD(P)/FAD-dependent oxidoreductase n=1 Tax=uncultured Methylobacterium sp. TaxID=157278 RepID=UPI0035CC3691